MNSLRQQLVVDRVENLARVLKLKREKAFERLVAGLTTNQSVHSIDSADDVDGGQDKQIDFISINEDDGEAEVTIFSAKFTDSFSSNALVLMGNGLEWVFLQSRKNVQALGNDRFRTRILDLRDLQRRIGPSNISIRCYFATKGSTTQLSQEFRDEADRLRGIYSNGTFASFSLEPLGCDELVRLINQAERVGGAVNADLPIRCPSSTPSLIRYDSKGLKGIVCTASAGEIAKLVNQDPNGAIFDANIRRFLGMGRKSSVNHDIHGTASSAASSHLFWFLNNGITILAEHVDPFLDPDNPIVKLKNLQIVNGCQTASALALASKEGSLRPDTNVLVKIFEASDASLADKIVRTTNTQNKIGARDLKANDEVQQDMRAGFERYQLHYEHKANQFASAPRKGWRIVSNEAVGQAFLAIALKRPADARRRKYKVWSESYGEIFNKGPVEGHVLCTLIAEECARWAKPGTATRRDGLASKLRRNAVLHIARIAARRFRGTNSFGDQARLEAEIGDVQKSGAVLWPHFEKAIGTLVRVIAANPDFKVDVDDALKSQLLDNAITRTLEQPRAKRGRP